MEGLHPTGPENSREMPLERITSAAVKFNGEVFTDVNHGRTITKIAERYGWKKYYAEPHEEGFVTSFGRFVDRKEGARIGELAGQTNQADVDARIDPDEMDSSELIGKRLH